MRRCNIPPPSCRYPVTTPCCKDCRATGCPARCENDPRYCNCWSDKPPKQKRTRKVSTLQVAFLYGQVGLTQAEIAGQLGCARSTVCNILRELGVTKHGQA